MPWGGVYDHITVEIGCHGDHMIEKVPNASCDSKRLITSSISRQ